MVVLPTVRGGDVRGIVESVTGPVILVRTAFGHHLDLAADRTGEVSRLVKGGYSELFDALHRSRHDTGGASVRLCAALSRKVCHIACIVSGHVVRIVASVEGKYVLIGEGAGGVAGGGGPGLQHGEGRYVTAHVRQELQC